MAWNGSGDFQRTHNFSADASAGIKILATRQDAEWANFEAGLENCITRDGQNSPTADLPMAGQKHVNVGAPTSVTQYLRVAEFQRSYPIYCAFSGNAENMSASAPFAITSLTAGLQVLLSCPSVNATSSVTLELIGAGRANVKYPTGFANDPIFAGATMGLHRYIYDGTDWIITDPCRPVLYQQVAASAGDSVNLTSTVVPEISATLGVIRFNKKTAATLSFFSSSTASIPGAVGGSSHFAIARVFAQIGFQSAPSAGVCYGFIMKNGSAVGLGTPGQTPLATVYTPASTKAFLQLYSPRINVAPGDQLTIHAGTNISSVNTDVSTTWAYVEITPA